MAKINLTKSEWSSLKQMLSKGALSVGSQYDPIPIWGTKIETVFPKKLGSKRGVFFNSCTSAIHGSLSVLGVSHLDEVIVSPLTCYSSVLPVSMVGGVPVFCDVDYETLTISPKSLKKTINSNTKAVLFPYLYGINSDIRKIRKICSNNEVKLIEDCAHTPGLKVGEQFAGTIGDIGVFSFAQNKVLDSGEGGIAITNNETLYKDLVSFRDGGQKAYRVYASRGANYRVPDIVPFLALKQFNDLNKNIAKRKKIAKIFFNNVPNRIIKKANDSTNSLPSVALFHSAKEARETVRLLRANNIDAKSIYRPLNLSNVFSDKDLLSAHFNHDKERIKLYLKRNNPTTVANSASEHYFYIETDPSKTKSFYESASNKCKKLLGV